MASLDVVDLCVWRRSDISGRKAGDGAGSGEVALAGAGGEHSWEVRLDGRAVVGARCLPGREKSLGFVQQPLEMF